MEQPDPRNKKIETFFILTQKEKYLKIVLYIYLKKSCIRLLAKKHQSLFICEAGLFFRVLYFIFILNWPLFFLHFVFATLILLTKLT